MRTSLTLFASAMLATAPFVLAGEDEWITAVVELTSYWVPSPHSAHSTCTDEHHPHPSWHPSHTPPASYYPPHNRTGSCHHPHTGTGSYYPSLPTVTVTVSVTVYPEGCASTPSSTPPGLTASGIPQPSNSTGGSSTPSHVPPPPNGTYGNNGTNSTNGTILGTTGGAAPMGTSFTAGIVGALGVLFALL